MPQCRNLCLVCAHSACAGIASVNLCIKCNNTQAGGKADDKLAHYYLVLSLHSKHSLHTCALGRAPLHGLEEHNASCYFARQETGILELSRRVNSSNTFCHCSIEARGGTTQTDQLSEAKSTLLLEYGLLTINRACCASSTRGSKRIFLPQSIPFGWG